MGLRLTSSGGGGGGGGADANIRWGVIETDGSGAVRLVGGSGISGVAFHSTETGKVVVTWEEAFTDANYVIFAWHRHSGSGAVRLLVPEDPNITTDDARLSARSEGGTLLDLQTTAQKFHIMAYKS